VRIDEELMKVFFERVGINCVHVELDEDKDHLFNGHKAWSPRY